MTTDMPQTARPDDPRHVHGPRPLGALVPAITRPAYRRRAPAAAQLMADWPALVGPELAAVTTPRRFAAGTLTIACAGPVALELQHLATQVTERVNAGLGRRIVERLRFLQDATPPPTRPPPAARAPASLPAAAERALADLPEGPLRDALRALGSAVHTARR
jgi:hypothetical protein